MYRGINNLFWVASFPVKYILNINTKLYIYRYIDICTHTYILYMALDIDGVLAGLGHGHVPRPHRLAV